MVEFFICIEYKTFKWFLIAIFFKFDCVLDLARLEVELQATVVILFDDCSDESCCFDQLTLAFIKILFFLKFYPFVERPEEDEDRKAEESDDYPHHFENIFINLLFVDSVDQFNHFVSVVVKVRVSESFLLDDLFDVDFLVHV